jgi:hypothetical protein
MKQICLCLEYYFIYVFWQGSNKNGNFINNSENAFKNEIKLIIRKKYKQNALNKSKEPILSK